MTREDQRKLTRRRIIDAARALFYENGVAEVSVDQIAKAAEVGRATLYLHFPNKDAILLQLLEHNLAAVRRIFAKLCELERIDLPAVKSWLQGYIDTLQSHRDATRLVHAGIATTSNARMMVHEHHVALSEMLAARFDGITDGSERGRARLLLLLARVDYFAGAAADVPPRMALDDGMDLVAREIIDFIEGR